MEVGTVGRGGYTAEQLHVGPRGLVTQSHGAHFVFVHRHAPGDIRTVVAAFAPPNELIFCTVVLSAHPIEQSPAPQAGRRLQPQNLLTPVLRFPDAPSLWF